ncbi:MAG: ammonium transporter [Planctomycetota bacterium]
MTKLVATATVVACASTALGQEDAAEAVEAATEAITLAPVTDRFVIDNLWLLLAAAMVFLMHLGFASLESGLTRAKNTVNILFKNSAIIAIGLLTYLFIGFNLMYPGEGWLLENWIGALGMATPPADGTGMTPDYGAYTYWSDFIFQAMFAATAATIVSGAVAERIKLGPFLIFSALYVAIIYPIVGSWKWGYGFLDDLGFYDFAGSTIVHSVGGWGALAGVIVLGPRLGKYVKRENGKVEIRPLMGHSMPLAAIGVFLLWFGWFGFNGGSVLSADPGGGEYGFKGVSLVFVTTSIAAAAGIVGAMVTSWVWTKQPDLSMTLNGALAGLVGITAGADVISVPNAAIIGLVAGIIVVLAVTLLDRAKLDDPVGAISVHLVCGIWGTLAVGIFGNAEALDGAGGLLDQLIGIGAVGAICFPAALLFFFILKVTIGLRVPREEELMGLDVGEHGMEAYAGFQIFTTQ